MPIAFLLSMYSGFIVIGTVTILQGTTDISPLHSLCTISANRTAVFTEFIFSLNFAQKYSEQILTEEKFSS